MQIRPWGWVIVLMILIGFGPTSAPSTFAASPQRAAIHSFLDSSKPGCRNPAQDKDGFLQLVDHCISGDREWWAGRIIEQLGPRRTKAHDFTSLRAEFDGNHYVVVPCTGHVDNFGWIRNGSTQELVSVRRDCYRDEHMLAYVPWSPHPSVILSPSVVVVSLTCINPQEVLPLPPIVSRNTMQHSSHVWISKGFDTYPHTPDTQVVGEEWADPAGSAEPEGNTIPELD